MNQVGDFFHKLLDTSDFPPRWHSGTWSNVHGWFYIISDLLIWSAYFAIPIIIVRYISRRKELHFVRIYFLFAAFILACGSTHFLDALTFWYPVYRLSALIRFITGILSWITVFSLMKILPKAFSLKTREAFEIEIQNREKAEELLRINNELLNEAQYIARMGHWRWDTESNLMTWSSASSNIYGIMLDGPYKMPVDYESYLQKIHPDDREYVSENIIQAFEKKKYPDFYHRILLPNGHTRTVLSKGEVLVNEKLEVVQMIGTIQDVTEQKKIEQELLAKSKALEESNAELEKFASVASHDLREPLRKIVMFASLLENGSKDSLSDKGRIYLEKITSASFRMQNLINDILEFSKIVKENYSFVKTNLNEILTQVISDVQVIKDNNNAEIIVENLPEIDANPSQMEQLFLNIISNAIKFSKAGVKPRIHIYAEIVRGSSIVPDQLNMAQYFPILSTMPNWDVEKFCRIYIEDNGIGFDETYLDRIFLLFQRLHNTSEYEGTGIGLAICRKVVEMHFGSITAQSTQGEGSTFIITLPVSQKHFGQVAGIPIQ
ncbi:MAG: PAS domain-containing protein [Taibaiella sp.]|nr:PAS domain-containing protein [Taibaiella sp.]